MQPFTPDRWRVLSPYLDEALELTVEQRAGWLDTVRARDASLAEELETLLVEHEEVHDSGFLEGAVFTPGMAPTPSLAGQVLGAYRLVSPIGQGGMGSVWLAERCDGRFQGRAAVKLLNTALMGRAGEERFRREGTILARVRHPRIAHLIDAGVSPSGQPFLVLEHVDGQRIDKYCDAHALGIEARLRLFLDVLEAVAHAHASLVVHRDIKPANVLVSADGQIKLLDFGIAKLIEHHAEWDGATPGPGALTHEGGAALTPEYAAPEQLAGGDVTTATDVYALGVLLYGLLSGQHPAGRAVHSPATLIRAIVDTEPPRVSSAVVSEAEPRQSIERHAACCGTTPARLSRLLRGDLDTIVAKALKKEPSARYATVTALADDIRRFLDQQPITARPDSLRYRTTRFVQRHMRGVVASAAVMALGVAMTVLYTVQLAAERDRARREAEKAARVSEALTGLLTSADPISNRATGEALTVRGLLDAGVERMQTDLADQPEAQAEILTVVGRLYRRFGEYDKAQQLLEQALVSGRQAFGTDHVRVALTLNDIGALLAEKGAYAEAGGSLEEALDMRRRIHGPEHRDVAVTLAELGRVYQDQGFNDRAEPLHREALAIRQKLLGEGDRETAVSLSDVASVLRLKGDLDGAESLLRQCLEINRKTRGETHANTGTTLHDLGLIAAARGDHAAAERLFQQALNIHRTALGERHPLLAWEFNSLSHVWLAQGRYDEAASALQEALALARPALGDDNQLIAIYTINLAAVQLARKQFEAAEALLREGLRIRLLSPAVVPNRRRILPEDDWSIGATKSLLGASLTALGRYEEAETMLLQARRDLAGMPAPRAGEMQVNLGRLVDLYVAWGRRDRAAEYRTLTASR
ncbi:MAG: tetratricopeptide repeat protein [Vicinamibacterales bacterium]